MLFIASTHEHKGLGPCTISQDLFILSVCNYLVSFTLRSQLSYIFSCSLRGEGKKQYASKRKFSAGSHRSAEYSLL